MHDFHRCDGMMWDKTINSNCPGDIMSNGYFDFHVHPTIKPIGRIVGKIVEQRLSVLMETLGYVLMERRLFDFIKCMFLQRKKISVWHDKTSNHILKAHHVKYSLSNYTISTMDIPRCVMFDLYPIEKEFFRNNLKSKQIRFI